MEAVAKTVGSSTTQQRRRPAQMNPIKVTVAVDKQASAAASESKASVAAPSAVVVIAAPVLSL